MADMLLDKHQLKILFRTGMKLEWRGANNPFVGYGTGKSSKTPGMLMILGIMLIASVFLGAVMYINRDYFTGLTIIGMGAIGFVALQILIDFGSIIISPQDFDVLAPHPVNSKTYFTAKLMHLLAYTSIFTFTLAVFPMVAAAIKHQTWWAAPVVLLHFWICIILTSFAMMNLYTIVLKFVDKRRLERLMGYLQVVMIIGLTSAWVLFSMSIVPEDHLKVQPILTQAKLALEFLPSYWLAGPFMLIVQGWNVKVALLSLTGYGLLLLLGRMAISYLSITYAETISKAGWNREIIPRKKESRITNKILELLGNHEDVAIWQLMKAEYKNDIKFRLAILTAFWLPIVYIGLSLLISEGDPINPFAVISDGDPMMTLLLGMGMGFLPATLCSAMLSSKSWRASWVFFATPVDREKLVNAVSRIVSLILCIPLGLVLLICYIYFLGNTLHALLHTFTLITYGLLGLSFFNIFVVSIPFGTEQATGGFIGEALGPGIGWMLLSMAPAFIVARFGYGGYTGWAITVTGLMIVKWVFGIVRNVRINRKIRAWQFEG